ncbi:MAG: TolC family protein [Caulobacter sp.]|nr:TolC family protein [Caulobacter sp.]
MSPLKLAWLLALSATAVSAHAEPLTFDQALALAGETAPSLRAAALRVDAARSASRSAGSLPDPKIALGIENLPISGPMAGRFGADEMTMASVGVMQDMPSRPARRAAVERAGAEIGMADAQTGLEKRAVRLAVAQAWVDLYYAQARLAALDEVEKALTPILGTAPSAVTRGARPAETIEPAEWLLAIADRRSALMAEVEKARAALVQWAGDPEASVSGEPPRWEVDPVTLRAGLDRHPILLTFDAGARLADADLAGARAALSPDWSWELAYQRRDPTFGDMVSARVTVSLPFRKGERQGPTIDARSADAGRARVDREIARRQLVAALDGDLATLQMRQELWARARDGRLPLALRRADLETASYAAGTAGLPNVLAAFTALADAKLDLLDKEAEALREAVRINITYGSDAS